MVHMIMCYCGRYACDASDAGFWTAFGSRVAVELPTGFSGGKYAFLVLTIGFD